MPRGIGLLAVGTMFGGSLIAYSALKGYSPSAVLRNVVAGKDPTKLSQVTAIDYQTRQDVRGVAYSTSAIVDDAMQYLGVPYRWGGYTTAGWDCSGFVNHVIGADLGLPIPGIKHFTGNWHGPTAAMWYMWIGATTIPRDQAQPGDLACWLTHIGIIVGSNRMVNAHSTGNPTEVTSIDGVAPAGEPLRVRRLNTGGGVMV